MLPSDGAESNGVLNHIGHVYSDVSVSFQHSKIARVTMMFQPAGK